ncbi:MAG: winged helix-turn-helix domain-containing protein [Rickettsiaceae bacterium]|nr:winged helix-turn-helix domain-containing protein [Rickettsiaceae bacterium]
MSDKLPPKILVVEHNEALNASLCNTIERYWFDVSRVKNSEEALRIAEVNPPNVAIISSRINGMSAKEMAVCLRKIKELKKLPVIFLIDQDESAENYQLSDAIVSEVISRPFTPNELMTTIRALLRKSKPVFQDKVIKYDNIRMDLSTYRVFRGNKQVHLGPTEFKILQLFVQKPNSVYSRRQIIDYVWGADKDIAHRTIDVHVNRIRTLMRSDADDSQLIKTIRSAGYCLN